MRDQLLTELTGLRKAAESGTSVSGPGQDSVLRFPPGEGILLVCAPLPADTLAAMPQSDVIDPDHTDLYAYNDLDALLELYGRLSALNPDSRIKWILSDQLTSEHYTYHLIMIGGVDWNAAVRDLGLRTSAPIQQLSRDTKEDIGGFKVDGAGSNNESKTFAPRLVEIDGQTQLIDDVAQIYFGPNPYYRERTVMSFNGQFARGTLGAVRALTDPVFRDQNEEYISNRFAGERHWSLLTKVVVAEGQPITPVWPVAGTLYEWPARQASRG